jgi:metal transporter CNNM
MGESDSSLSSSENESDSGTSGISSKRRAGRKNRNRRKTTNGSKKNHDVEQGNGEAEDGIVNDADGDTLKEHPTLESVLLTPPSIGASGTVVGTSPSQEVRGHRQNSGSTSSTGKKSESKGIDSDVAIVHDTDAGTGVGKKKTAFHLSTLSKQAGAVMNSGSLEQHTPADAVLAKEGAAEVSLLGYMFLMSVMVIIFGSSLSSFCKASTQRLCPLESSHSRTFWKVRLDLKIVLRRFCSLRHRANWRGNLR